jgi:hypothetical protein
MHRHHSVGRSSESASGNYSIPLLDDEFDPEAEEAIDHDDAFLLRLREPLEDESDFDSRILESSGFGQTEQDG